MAKPYMPYHGPIVTRLDAVAAGLPRWFSGLPCNQGHLAERSAKTTHCIQCKREDSSRRRLADPHAKEKDAIRRLEKGEDIRGYKKRYNDANKPLIAKTGKAWRDINPDKVALGCKVWAKAHPEARRAIVAKRRATRLGSDGHFSKAEIAQMLIDQRHKCAGCRVSIKKYYEIDHILALAKGGSNDIRNIQLLCMPCNRQKGAKHPVDWAMENGRLL